MLKQRVLTALAILPIALAAIILTPLLWFDGLLVVLLAGLMREWVRLTRLPTQWQWLPVLLAPLVFAVGAIDWQYQVAWRETVLLLAVVFWITCPAWFITRFPLATIAKVAIGVIVVAGAGTALHVLKQLSPNGLFVLLVFLLVWAADVGAYFAGKSFGRHKLAPNISPGKTWEGFFGGLLLTVAVGLIAGHYLAGLAVSMTWIVVLVAVAVVSVVGDLVESLLKRQADAKDSGSLLPGHGGLLDRLDSVLAAAPLFIFFIEHSGLLAMLDPVTGLVWQIAGIGQ